jgi:hypothetical protein
MAILCLFRPCRRVAIVTIGSPLMPAGWRAGVYQCRRCKAVSLGAPF